MAATYSLIEGGSDGAVSLMSGGRCAAVLHHPYVELLQVRSGSTRSRRCFRHAVAGDGVLADERCRNVLHPVREPLLDRPCAPGLAHQPTVALLLPGRGPSASRRW